MGLMMKNFNIIISILLKNPIFRYLRGGGGLHEKKNLGGGGGGGVNHLKRGTLG